MKESLAPLYDPRGKFRRPWYGLYLVKEITTTGAVKLVDFNWNEFSSFTKLD